MKQTKLFLVPALIALLLGSTSALAKEKAKAKEASTKSTAAKYEAGSYDIDPAHSSVGFEIPHLVISTVEGKFNSFSGKIDLNEKIEKSSVEVSIETASIDTGVKKRDDHLRSGDFFDVDKKENKNITFKSTSVQGSLENLEIKGQLTIKGKTNPVTLKTKYLGTVVDGYGNKKVAFNAKTEINRQDFGLTWSSMIEAGPAVGDTVTITLKIQAAKSK